MIIFDSKYSVEFNFSIDDEEEIHKVIHECSEPPKDVYKIFSNFLLEQNVSKGSRVNLLCYTLRDKNGRDMDEWRNT